MHNVYFKTLEQLVDFYNTRDAKPRCDSSWTSVADAEKQGCWPEPEYPETVCKMELGSLQHSPPEQTDLDAFLDTLSDDES